MKRQMFIIALTIVVLFSTLMNVKSLHLNSQNGLSQDDNWSMQVSNSITQINENMTKLDIDYTVTFTENVYIPIKYYGGVFIRIWNENFSWVPYTASQVTYTNFYQEKGSTSTSWSVTFNRSNYLESNPDFVNHNFLININQSGLFNISYNPDRELAGYIGTLNITLNGPISVSINPTFWTTSGFINNTASSSTYTSTDTNSSSSTNNYQSTNSSFSTETMNINPMLFLSLLPFMIILGIRKKKNNH